MEKCIGDTGGILPWLLSHEYLEVSTVKYGVTLLNDWVKGAYELHEPFYDVLQDETEQSIEHAKKRTIESFEHEKEVIARNGFKFKYSDICYIMVQTDDMRDKIVEALPFLKNWVYLKGETNASLRQEEPDAMPPDPNDRNYHKDQTHFPFYKPYDISND